MASNIASTSTSPASAPDAAAAAHKLRTGLEHKAQGNAAFTQGDIKAALASYHHAVLYLSGLEGRSILGLVGETSGREGKPEDLSSDEDEDDAGEEQPETMQSEKHLSMVYSNMAACYLKQKNYARAIQTAEKSLKCDSGNVKAKFRKAQAMRLEGELYKAQEFCKETIEGLRGKKKGNKEAVERFERELAAVEKLIAAKEDKSRSKWKGFLGKKNSATKAANATADEKKTRQDEVSTEESADQS
ncbi:uncharacterized protein SPSC_01220 [Sporisorium scitamineum]|uniref:Uncharacterized protein n=1 Tax=Sporisorium scitamineum TaxID=49012 RepID=A0A0F7S107_9BASI|nr:hypothetical protein [Sporisorium scitamineum]CDU22590.1 uncharacterized protein SPSC_01220 [Sporisorium scitamineum]